MPGLLAAGDGRRMNITQRYCGVCGHGYRVRVDTNGNGGLQETPPECPHCEGGKMKCPNCGKEGNGYGSPCDECDRLEVSRVSCAL